MSRPFLERLTNYASFFQKMCSRCRGRDAVLLKPRKSGKMFGLQQAQAPYARPSRSLESIVMQFCFWKAFPISPAVAELLTR